LLRHLLFSAYIIDFVIGFATILFSILFYLKERIKWVQYYLVLLVTFSVLLGIYFLQLYQFINSNVTSDVLTIFIFINLGLLVFLIPFVMTRLAALQWTKRHNAVFIPIVTGYTVMLILTYALNRHIVFYTIMNALFYGSVIYSLIFAASCLKKIQLMPLKIIMSIFILLTSIFLPIFFYDTYAAEILFHTKTRNESSYQMWSLPVYYFWWNITVLGYFVSHFYKLQTNTSPDINAEFVNKYHITVREKEIITMVMKGKSNRAIAQDINVSISTVNNHLAHIYEKTNFKSRFELITLGNL